MIRRPPRSTLFPYTSSSDLTTEHLDTEPRRISPGGTPYGPWHDVTTALEGPVEGRSEEHTSELQSHSDLVCRLLLEKKKTKKPKPRIQHIDKENNYRNTDRD